MNRKTYRACAASVICLSATVFGGGDPPPLPTTVHVYNQNPNLTDNRADKFDNNVEGFIWQLLGLLDANGRPIDPIPEAQIIRANPPEDNTIIGYRSADGTQEAYNINATTLERAWGRVADGGRLHIAKHGLYYVVSEPNTADDELCGNGAVDPGEACDASADPDGCEAPYTCNAELCLCTAQGGGIILDGGNARDGFGDDGTGAGYGDPYPLPPRPGAGITLDLNSCYSSHDPDGPDGDERPVTESGEDIGGVGTATGHDGVVYARVAWSLQGGTPAQRAAALAALRAAARAAGFPPVPTDGSARPPTTDADIGEWIATRPFATRYATVQAAIDAAVPPPGTVVLRLVYAKDEEQPNQGEGEGGFYHIPTMFVPFFPGRLDLVYRDQFVAASLAFQPNSFEFPPVLHADQASALPAPLPPGFEQASGMFWFETRNNSYPFAPVTISFGYEGPLSGTQVLWYDAAGGQWAAPQGVVNLDPTTNMVTIHTTQLGTYVAIRSVVDVPAVSDGWLGALACLVLIAGSLAIVSARRLRRAA